MPRTQERRACFGTPSTRGSWRPVPTRQRRSQRQPRRTKQTFAHSLGTSDFRQPARLGAESLGFSWTDPWPRAIYTRFIGIRPVRRGVPVESSPGALSRCLTLPRSAESLRPPLFRTLPVAVINRKKNSSIERFCSSFGLSSLPIERFCSQNVRWRVPIDRSCSSSGLVDVHRAQMKSSIRQMKNKIERFCSSFGQRRSSCGLRRSSFALHGFA